MSRAVRQAALLERVERDGSVSVADLADQFVVSAITIHRDLEQLASEGLITRVHGGARSLTRSGPSADTDFRHRLQQSWALKQAIAAQAAAWVEDGSSIFVDASTSGLTFARHLERNPPNSLTLVTTSPAIAYELNCASIHVIVAPGELHQNVRVIGGQWTVEFLQGLNISVAFVSCFGITLESGLTTGQRDIGESLKATMANAARTVALVDSTKFGRCALMTIARAKDVDAVVVDSLLAETVRTEYMEAGVNLVVAPAEPQSSPGG